MIPTPQTPITPSTPTGEGSPSPDPDDGAFTDTFPLPSSIHSLQLTSPFVSVSDPSPFSNHILKFTRLLRQPSSRTLSHPYRYYVGKGQKETSAFFGRDVDRVECEEGIWRRKKVVIPEEEEEESEEEGEGDAAAGASAAAGVGLRRRRRRKKKKPKRIIRRRGSRRRRSGIGGVGGPMPPSDSDTALHDLLANDPLTLPTFGSGLRHLHPPEPGTAQLLEAFQDIPLLGSQSAPPATTAPDASDPKADDPKQAKKKKKQLSQPEPPKQQMGVIGSIWRNRERERRRRAREREKRSRRLLKEQEERKRRASLVAEGGGPNQHVVGGLGAGFGGRARATGSGSARVEDVSDGSGSEGRGISGSFYLPLVARRGKTTAEDDEDISSDSDDDEEDEDEEEDSERDPKGPSKKELRRQRRKIMKRKREIRKLGLQLDQDIDHVFELEDPFTDDSDNEQDEQNAHMRDKLAVERHKRRILVKKTQQARQRRLAESSSSLLAGSQAQLMFGRAALPGFAPGLIRPSATAFQVAPPQAPQPVDPSIPPQPQTDTRLLKTGGTIYKTKRRREVIKERLEDARQLEDGATEAALRAGTEVGGLRGGATRETQFKRGNRTRFRSVQNAALLDPLSDWDSMWSRVEEEGPEAIMREKARRPPASFFDHELSFERVETSQKSKKKRTRTGAGGKKRVRFDLPPPGSSRSDPEEEGEMHPLDVMCQFDLSNDLKYEVPNLAETKKTGRQVTRHSRPAVRLDSRLFKTDFQNEAETLQFLHRPVTKDFRPGIEYPISFVPPKPPRRNFFSQKSIRTRRGLVPDDHRVVLMEYIEEHPALVNTTGMGTRIFEYVLAPDGAVASRDRAVVDGVTIVDGVQRPVTDQSELPLLGTLKEDGDRLFSIENDLFAAAMHPHPPVSVEDGTENKYEDFLLMFKRGADKKDLFQIREIPLVYLVGHTQHRAKVPVPGSRADPFITNRLEQFVKQHFLDSMAKREPAQITTSEIRKTFPTLSDSRISRKLKDFCNMKRSGSFQYWTLKDDVRLTDAELQRLVRPEMVCAQEAKWRGDHRLSERGIDIEVQASAFGIADAALCDKELIETIRYVERETNSTPWNETTSHIDMSSGNEDPVMRLLPVARSIYEDAKDHHRLEDRVATLTKQAIDQSQMMSEAVVQEFLLKRNTREQIDRMTNQAQRHEARRIRDELQHNLTSKKAQKGQARLVKTREVLAKVFGDECRKLKSQEPYYRVPTFMVGDIEDDSPEFSDVYFFGEEDPSAADGLLAAADESSATPSESGGPDSSRVASDSESDNSSVASSTDSLDRSSLPALGASAARGGSGSGSGVGGADAEGPNDEDPEKMIKYTLTPEVGEPIVKYFRTPAEFSMYRRRWRTYGALPGQKQKKASVVFIGALKSETFQTNKTQRRHLQDHKRKISNRVYGRGRKKTRGRRRGRGGRRRGGGSRAPRSRGKKPTAASSSSSSSSSSRRTTSKRSRGSLNRKLLRIVNDFAGMAAFHDFVGKISSFSPFDQPAPFQTYCQKISPGKPMSLSQIMEKCQDNVYRSKDAFLSDVRMIRDNCHRYWGDEIMSLCDTSTELYEEMKESLEGVHASPPRRRRDEGPPKKRRKLNSGAPSNLRPNSGAGGLVVRLTTPRTPPLEDNPFGRF